MKVQLALRYDTSNVNDVCILKQVLMLKPEFLMLARGC